MNDQIIAFYFQYLELKKFKSSLKNILFVPPSVAQLLKLSKPEDIEGLLKPLKPDQQRVIFFAVNDNESSRGGGTHWSLLVFSRKENTFFSFDSLMGLNRSASLRISSLLRFGLNCPTADFIEHPSTPQINAYDCGIHLLANAEHIANHYITTGTVNRVENVDRRKIDSMRQDILDLIRELEGQNL